MSKSETFISQQQKFQLGFVLPFFFLLFSLFIRNTKFKGIGFNETTENIKTKPANRHSPDQTKKIIRQGDPSNRFHIVPASARNDVDFDHPHSPNTCCRTKLTFAGLIRHRATVSQTPPRSWRAYIFEKDFYGWLCLFCSF